MGLIHIKHKGSFTHTDQFFNHALKANYRQILRKYGEKGVQALRDATPRDTGKTADSWNYDIEEKDGKITLFWTNSNENDGVNIAVLLIYGHGLQNGGYVPGNDFVSPAIRPIFEDIANQCWKEVRK